MTVAVKTWFSVAALATLANCAPPPRSATHVARPGYTCAVGRAFENGAWAEATLDDEGRQVHASWGWRATLGEPLRWALAAETAEGSAPFGDGRAYASLSWVIPARRPVYGRLVLTSAPPGMWAPFAGTGERAIQYQLATSWPDLVAFARGATALTLQVRDRRDAPVASMAIDPSVFVAGDAAVKRAISELDALRVDYHARCHVLTDTNPDIVVT